MKSRSHSFVSPIAAPAGLLWQSGLATLTALLLIFSFPPVALSWMAWVALVPLLYALAQVVSWRRALWLGWLAGIVFTFFAENWITHSMTRYGGLPAVAAYGVALLFAAVLALFPALFAVAMARLLGRFGYWALALAPFVWAATEYLRPIFTGVTWNALGVSQTTHYRIAQLAQFGGAYLISALLVTASALLVMVLRLKQRAVGRAAAVLLMTAAMTFLLPTSQRTIEQQVSANLTAIGVQPNLSPDGEQSPEAFARDLEHNIRLTREAIKRAPNGFADVVIWAESPLAIFYENDPGVRARLDALARETGSYFIISTATRDDGRYYNSVHTISPRDQASSAPVRRYDKMRLVPFGEYVPWRSLLGRFVPPMVGDFTPGREAIVNTLRLETERAAIVDSAEANALGGIERTTNFVRTGSFICYEAAYPELVRRFVQRGATLLINVSNDAWFGNTAGARQHLEHARLRAIENDRDLLRVTNSGITALLTADGRVVDPLPVFTPGAQVWATQARRGQTFYVRHGDWFGLACALFAALLLVLSFLKLPAPVAATPR